MEMRKFVCSIIIFWMIIFPLSTVAQENTTDLKSQITSLKKDLNNLQHDFDQVRKGIDDILWFHRLGDIAYIDKAIITGPPPRIVKNPDATGANNPLKFQTYIFIPRNIGTDKKYPLIVLPHGGVHGDFTTYYTHIMRELLAQGYVVVAPEYRGSTGYGKSFYEKIDYGGLETEDAHASMKYVVENYDFVDKSRVGIIGWSHGGLISLMTAFDHPEDYQVIFAGVPVSDLISRMGYYDDEYRALYSADYHIGQTAKENIDEYRKRSPAWNAHRLKTPLLIHTNTNDDDVNVLEVEHLIKSLKAEGKKFEYEIFKDVAGGHSFDRIDNKQSKEIRLKIWKFLYNYLKPSVKFTSVKDMEKAAYFGHP